MDLVLVLLLLSLHSNTISHLDFSLAPRYDYTVFRKIIYISRSFWTNLKFYDTFSEYPQINMSSDGNLILTGSVKYSLCSYAIMMFL